MLHYIQALLGQLDLSSALDAVLRAVSVLLCLTIHETCHGLAALSLGDPTAKSMHRLSLNPLRHIDWLGLLMMFAVGFGWAKPVPVDPRYFKDPKKGMALTALAGPVSNFMFLNGEDVSEEIRLPEVSRYASAVSAHSDVRAYLLDMQRDLARKHSVVMDGRDIGTVVLPDADVKIFLTASAEARAQRRCLELQQRGTPEPFDQVLSEIVQRDWDDTHRAAAPLRQAEDAVMVDTTDLDFQGSLAALLRVVGEEMK